MAASLFCLFLNGGEDWSDGRVFVFRFLFSIFPRFVSKGGLKGISMCGRAKTVIFFFFHYLYLFINIIIITPIFSRKGSKGLTDE